MSLLGLGLWFIVGVCLAGAVGVFWDNIREWLQNTAANAVEKMFGYNARQNMLKAISKVDRLMNKVRNHSVVYSKLSPFDTTYVETKIVAEANVEDIDYEVLDEIRKNGSIKQTFEYKI